MVPLPYGWVYNYPLPLSWFTDIHTTLLPGTNSIISKYWLCITNYITVSFNRYLLPIHDLVTVINHVQIVSRTLSNLK